MVWITGDAGVATDMLDVIVSFTWLLGGITGVVGVATDVLDVIVSFTWMPSGTTGDVGVATDVPDVIVSFTWLLGGTMGLFFLKERDGSDFLSAGGRGLGPVGGGGIPAATRCLVESELPAPTLSEGKFKDLTRGLTLWS